MSITNGESEDVEFRAVYLARGFVLSLSYVEPSKRDWPTRSDGPDLCHTPITGPASATPTAALAQDRTTSRALTRTKRKRRPQCWNRRLWWRDAL